MATIKQSKTNGLVLYAKKQYLEALRLYDAILRECPLDYEARLRVADCLVELDETKAAIEVYRAVAWYTIKSGHPLCALVAIKMLEVHNDNTEDLIMGLIMHYGSDSPLLGKFAARIRLPQPTQEIGVPDDSRDIQQAAQYAKSCTDSFSEYPEVLHPLPLFSSLSEKVFEKVLGTVVIHRMANQQRIIQEGELGESFFLIASGQVQVFSSNDVGEKHVLASLGEHAVFGEMALLSNQPRSASVEVIGEADLIEMTRTSLNALANELEQVAGALHDFTRARLLSNLMARSPLFKPFSEIQQRDLLRWFTEHDLAGGTEIIREATEGRGLFMILSGEVEIIKQGSTLTTLKTGEIFGEMALIRDELTSATVRATIPTTVLFLDRSYVSKMINGIPKIRAYLDELTENREIDAQHSLMPANLDESIDILI